MTEVTVVRSRTFVKQIEKFPVSLRRQARDRIRLLVTDATHPLLNDHKLNPPFDGYRSINITSDVRLVYKWANATTLHLRAIGTHHQLYKS